MISLRDVVTGFGNRDPLAEVWRRSLRGGGGGAAEITGVPPLRYIGDGRPLTEYVIAGNAVQDGTPSADAPVDAVGSGVRTGNLAKFWRTAYVRGTDGALIEQLKNGMAYPVKLLAGQTITFSDRSENYGRGFAIFQEFDGTTLSGLILRKLTTCTYTATENCYIVVWCNYDNAANITDANFGLCKAMLNLGSTALPYEPYGYKLPLTVNSVEYPIYLGTVPSTRRIKKLVLDGMENVSYNARSDTRGRYVVTIPTAGGTETPENVICTHFITVNNTSAPLGIGGICMRSTGADAVVGGLYADIGITAPSDSATIVNAFKAWLAAQYANGTPVTIWYVLAEPEAGIVNEPLMKIGDHADTISFEQSGVTIPTVNGENVLDVPTTPPPSEITIKGGIRSV